ncbi:c-type cytochrome biogenesis protein CcsB [Candidatus Poribacteria bacterium]|nr:c-type cytochrome biogenesis protein CcsB [Candidatus Poribacteria bacterium]
MNSASSILFTISLVVYLLATILYLLYAIFHKESIGKVATWILSVGIVVQTAALIIKTVQIGHAPFVTIYETLVFWSWLIAVIYLFMQIRFKIRVLGALITPLAFLAIASASLLPEQFKKSSPLVPALQSGWLPFHIATCFIGYACFAVSFAVSIAYLIKKKDNPDAMLSKERLDIIGYKSISIGFPFLTLGIISGAFWADVAWGSYWSWDPKETWSLITWFIYAIYLHLRIVAKWKGKYSAIVSIVGFLAVLFTFFGVNFLLSGLHSYQ